MAVLIVYTVFLFSNVNTVTAETIKPGPVRTTVNDPSIFSPRGSTTESVDKPRQETGSMQLFMTYYVVL